MFHLRPNEVKSTSIHKLISTFMTFLPSFTAHLLRESVLNTATQTLCNHFVSPHKHSVDSCRVLLGCWQTTTVTSMPIHGAHPTLSRRFPCVSPTCDVWLFSCRFWSFRQTSSYRTSLSLTLAFSTTLFFFLFPYVERLGGVAIRGEDGGEESTRSLTCDESTARY